jgi:hypothetical protein
MWPFYYLVGVEFSGATAVVAVVTNGVSVVYLCAAVRTFYGYTLKQALLRGPLLYLGYMIVYMLSYQVAMILALRSALG